MTGPYIAVAATVVAVAVIIAVSTWAHNYSTARIYQEAVTQNAQWAAVEPIAHEGVRWAQNAHCEATIWAVVLLVFVVVVLGYSFWSEVFRAGRR
jgi:hypothetical protein